MDLPKHILMAIEHEETLIKLRLDQIRGYQKRIELMKQGKGYGDSQREVRPIQGNLQFDWNKYFKIKKEYEKTKLKGEQK